MIAGKPIQRTLSGCKLYLLSSGVTKEGKMCTLCVTLFNAFTFTFLAFYSFVSLSFWLSRHKYITSWMFLFPFSVNFTKVFFCYFCCLIKLHLYLLHTAFTLFLLKYSQWRDILGLLLEANVPFDKLANKGRKQTFDVVTCSFSASYEVYLFIASDENLYVR